ncbi:MAG: hypothetical protein AMXMBFR36_24410 [Acidobacteriota bacterium]
MNRPAEALRHPALAPGRGAPLERADLTDRQRLGVVLQAAGLLSLCEAGGWRLADGWDVARVDGRGLLTGLSAVQGRSRRSTTTLLLELLRTCFGADDEIAGRGQARRAARALELRWSGVLDRSLPDQAIEELLAAAPFLGGAEFAAARAALEGTLVRSEREVRWLAGRGRSAAPCRRDPLALVSRGRWAEAARAFLSSPPTDAAGRLAHARALAGDGRVSAALALVAGRDDLEAEILRATCHLTLGELEEAHESVRRIEASDLSTGERLRASDIVLRVLSIVRRHDAARDWCATTVASARGGERRAGRLYAAQAAIDRGDVDAAARLLDEEREAESELPGQYHEVGFFLALLREDAERAREHAAARLVAIRRCATRAEAGRAWNNLGIARMMQCDFGAAERAYRHSMSLLRGCDGPLAVTLAGTNLVDTWLRLGRIDGVEPILEQALAWNRRSGNRRGAVVDQIIRARLDLARFDLERALARLAGLREEVQERPLAAVAGWRSVVEARALGWLGRSGSAAASLEAVAPEALTYLEPEERPFLFALAGRIDRALELAAAAGELAALVAPLVSGEVPPPGRWRALDRLEPYRRARFVLDAELAAPGSVPSERREEAAEWFRRAGIARAAERIERSRGVAWRALADYFRRPAGDPDAIESLLAAVGHSEAELVIRAESGEHRLAGTGARRLPAERVAAFGAAELVLRAESFDEPLRALFALFLRDVPSPPPEPAQAVGGMLGESPALRAALDRLRRFAASDLPVLILGENGTGKELAARLVHEASPRAAAPRIAVNCAGLSDTLLLAQLFGHARGAFTGADRERAGFFESARGGTVFLDEIGDFPAPAQGSLLRVLQEKEVQRLGESLPRRVDVRLVAATNRNLEAMVEEGRFRQDLYFRLKAATVVLPPLRERGQDALLLAEHFLGAQRRNRPGLKLTPEARRALAAHDWPGNVRELANVVAAAAVLSHDGRIAPEHLDLGGAAAAPAERADGGYHAQVETFRRRLIERALGDCEGNLAAAARKLGVSRQFLSQFVRKYGLPVN